MLILIEVKIIELLSKDLHYMTKEEKKRPLKIIAKLLK